MLTLSNYKKGFLIDEELMAGVTELPENGTHPFRAYVLRHTTGEYLGLEDFPSLENALDRINQVKREWKFEAAGGCGEADCGQKGCETTGVCNQCGACPK